MSWGENSTDLHKNEILHYFFQDWREWLSGEGGENQGTKMKINFIYLLNYKLII